METLKEESLRQNLEKTRTLESRNKELMRYAVEEVWNKGNFSVLKDLISSGFVFHSLIPKRELKGVEGAKHYFSSLRQSFPDIKFTIIDMVAEGNKIATHWIAEGTHLGDFEGIPPTGRRFKVSAINIDYLDNGKFTDCWGNMDELGLLNQLGILDNKEPGNSEGQRKAWDHIAEGYDRYVTDTEISLANEALKKVGLKAGQNFLDIAAGAGGLSLPAARIGAKVLATDWSPEMIKRFEMRVRKEMLSNAWGRVMDGHQLELEDNSFDVTGSQFGVMLFPDLPGALKEMVRVTKPGGKVLLIAYGAPEKIDFLNFFVKALQSVAPQFQGLPKDPPPLEFQVADPDILHQRLTEAGLKNVKVDKSAEEIEFKSGEQLWDWIINSNPIAGHIISELSVIKEQIEIIKQHLDQMIRERAGTNQKAKLVSPVNIGYGTK